MKVVSLIFCFIFVFLAPFSDAAEIHATAILLDVSRTVSSQKEFEKVKGIIQELIGQDRSPDVLSVYTFGTRLRQIDPNQLQSIHATESNTILYDAAYDAMQHLTTITADKKAILIFSDGIDTKSVTIPEDVVSFARDHSIVIHCIGMGRANRKLLERIAKLTGGNFFSVGQADLVSQIKMAIAVQKGTDKPDGLQQQPVEAPRPAQPSAVPAAPSPVTPASKPANSSYLWIVVILGAILAAGFVLVWRRRTRRICPTCKRPLESYQTICPDCPGQTIMQPVADLSLAAAPENNHNQESIPPERKDRKLESEEMLSKTYFLDEIPALVVTKGKNVGEVYRLSKESPVSIGRSRFNEIRPDDVSISAQHCRIIPENGEYVLYDLGSTNGTIVNHISVNKAVLEEGDTIKVGATVLLFTLHETR